MTRVELFTRRSFMIHQAILDGARWIMAVEAVTSTAIEHPEWDMSEQRTWDEWEKHFKVNIHRTRPTRRPANKIPGKR